MIRFNVTSAGQTALDGATAGSSPVIIDAVALYGGATGTSSIKTISEVFGSSYKDDTGIGPYCKISFEDNSDSSYTITMLVLKSGSTEIAKSELISVTKASNKGLQLEVSCQFTGAEKCSFNTIKVALPHSTQFREGVIRIARPTGETNKDFTVYNATQIDTIVSDIETITDGLVPWDTNSGSPVEGSTTLETLNIVNDYSTPTQTVTVEISGSASGGVSSLSVGGYITGTAVETTPHYSGAISASAVSDTAKLVNGTYISNIYLNEIQTGTETDIARKLVTSHAVRAYVEGQVSAINDAVVHKAGAETIDGPKTFTGGIVANSTISGSGIQSSTSNWDASGNASKLPTVGVVSAAITAGDEAVTVAFQQADAGLQEQIDGINAGQNLADIINSRGDDNTQQRHDDLALLDASNLNVGDKVQVLHDKTKTDGSIDTTQGFDGVSTVYTLKQVTSGHPAQNTREVAALNKSGYYWEYVGQYGCDSYTKSQSDDKYVIKDNLDQTISTASTNNAPSTKAVYDALGDLAEDVEDHYVKLVSATAQTIESELNIDTGSYTVSLTDREFASNSYYEFVAGDTTGNTYVKVRLESTYGQYIIYLGSSNKAFALEKTSNINSVIGTHVASYLDATHGGTLTDGRLVTVDYLNAFTGDMGAYAKLSAENNFTGNTNTFKGVSATSYTGTGVYSSYSSGSDTGGWDNSGSNPKVPTVASVRSAITDAKNDVLNTISSTDTIGSIGLFIYSEVGAEKGYGDTVDGQFLKAAAISLPMSGQISYKAVGLPMSGTWTLLSGAFKRTTATEPCLVLAQKISTQ